MALTKISGSVVQQNNFSLSGVVTATSFTGDLTGNVTGNVSGNLTGNVSGNVTGNLTGNVSSSGANTLGSLSVTNDATVGGALTVTGNLTVNGTTTTIDTVVTAVDSLAVDGNVTAGGNLNITGVSTFQNNVHLLDSDSLYFGAGNDLRILHDGANSYIKDDGTGNLFIQSNGSSVTLQSTSGSNFAEFVNGGAVNLYHNNSKKFETTGTGVTITGNARVTGILTVGQSSVTIDGTNNKITTPKLDYAGISSTITATAVDVFVYDTRKDSDGGAWRKRTQHTSWYNETLNTATRGSRREFPAVAVIVVTTNTITIYDGDDPDMPMWMKFTDGFNTYMGMGIGGLTSVSMLNGIMVHGGPYDVHVTNFISDKTNRYGDTSGITVNHKQPISGRNDDTAGNYNGPTTPNIVNRQVNDVAMTVLPNAPIDSATGLPVPTIAVATNGGVSIIKDDGTVYDVIDTNSARICYDVSFTKDHKIMHTGDLGAGGTHAGNVFVTNVLTADRAEYDNHGDLYRWYSTSSMYPRINGGNTFNTRVLDPIDVGGDHYAMADVGISLIEDGTSSSYGNTDGMVAYATTSYNTGWMHGDIKGAFLSDTSTASVTGTELVTNGTFTTDTSGWATDQGATLSVVSNRLRVTNGISDYGIAQTSITTVIGKKYVVSADFVAGTASTGDLRVSSVTFGNNIATTGISTNTQRSLTFVATTTTTYINVYGSNVSGQYTDWDNISVRLAEEDRSVNNKGLQVFGTITKSAVATGADLVKYGGFNTTSNYLEQPYNSDLTFGTNDFSVMCWYYNDTSTEIRVQRTTGGADGWALTLGNAGEDFYIHNGNFSTFAGFTDLTKVGAWTHFTIVRRYNDKWYVYKNGELAVTTTTLASNNFNDTGTFKVHAPSGSSANSIALLRVSQSVPSPEQIKKIYEDEKVLFQENAACTLYGSSDAVTALAYDDSNNLLHVGTSSGRSDFQGLRRINNTTTAVTTAMSASNGLVAEQ